MIIGNIGGARGRLGALLRAIERRDAVNGNPMIGLAARLERARLRADEHPEETDDELAAKRHALFEAIRAEQQRRW